MTPARHQNMAQGRIALLLGLTVGALGALVLVGWRLDLASLKSVFPGLTAMKANTALGMLLCGSALAFLSREKAAPQTSFLIRVLAAGVIALGALSLGEYLFGWEFGLDQWLFRDVGDSVGTSQPGRMSPATAFCFLLTGVALLAASQPASMRLRRPMLDALGLAMIVVAGLALAGYVSAALFSFRWWSYTGMAVHTAAGFMLLGFGLLALGRREGPLKWSLDSWSTRGFAVGILSLLAAAGISYHFTNQLQDSAAWVSHTQEVLKEIGGVTAGVASLGSSQRSFINTGSDRFLEQEQAVKLDLRQRIDSLRKLTADNPRQAPRLDQLSPLIAQRIEWGEKTIAARRQGGLSAAEQMIATGEGIELNDSIRRLIKALEDEEYGLLDQRQEKERTISTTTFLLLPLGAFLSITFLSLGLFFLNTGMGERAQAEEKAAWLATFPERNPSFIVELDLATGIIHYLNPYALRLLPDLQSQGLRHPWTAGLQEAAPALMQSPGEPLRREIAVGERFYAQTINYISETKRVRVYGTDITERKQSEAAAARLAAIVEFSDDAIVGKDLQGIVTSWNRGAENVFGYPAREMVGQPVARLIPWERLPEETEILSRIKRGENVPHFETVRLRKDGSTIEVSVTVSPIKDSAANVVGASKVARDITERKRAEEALRASEARLNFALETSHIGAWELSLPDHIATRTLIHDRIFGYNTLLPLWTFELFLEHVLPEDRVEVERSFHEATAALANWNFECRIRRADGEERWIWAAGGHELDAEGKAVRMSGIVQDITERKQAEKLLCDQARLLHLAHSAIMVRDPNSRVTFWSRGAERLYGWSAEEAIGRITHELFQTRFPKPLGEIEAELLERDYWQGELVHTCKDGSEITVDSRWALQRDAQGVLAGILEINNDITERKRAEEARLASEARYRTLFEYAPDGIVIVDPTGNYLDVNMSICKMLGYTHDEFLGLNASDIVAPEEIRLIGQALDEIQTKSGYRWVRGNITSRQALVEIQTKSGYQR